MRAEIKRRLTKLRPRIEEALDTLPLRAMGLRELRRILGQVVPSAYQSEFLEFLENSGLVQRIELRSPQYASFVRYVREGGTPFEVALSLRPGSYLSHASAVFIHALSNQVPQQIFVNREQSPKPESSGVLVQAAIEKAFARPQRRTNYTVRSSTYEVVLLNGKATGRLGVEVVASELGKALSVTTVERTLIDIAVRPLYAGGVFQVLEAYRGAKDRVSVPGLLSMLKKLEYKYPYHQAIGFYMEQAGFQEELLEQVAKLGMEFDFYLSHGLTKRKYVERWRLFCPEGF